MRYRSIGVALALAAVASIGGCAEERSADGPADSAVALAAPGPVVTFDGVGDVAFGDTEQSLTARGLVSRPEAACGPVLTGQPGSTPVFADDQLVLLWANPPLTTPEGIGVDSPVTAVRAAYPQAQNRPAPPGSHRFDGLLVTDDDRAYLFLHDGETVVKTIAGFTEYAQRLLDTGFGAC
jgi:hypothetical protein